MQRHTGRQYWSCADSRFQKIACQPIFGTVEGVHKRFVTNPTYLTYTYHLLDAERASTLYTNANIHDLVG